ncbi:MAG: PrsW family intramembrane metalloprotease [Candidatus Bathyarchaeota archaeon]|nr:PrsW family intramembrane metalloprotease [Candidatus Bathyarchaeota archaeon]
MSQGECVVKLHKPDADEKMFFFLCGVITSVPLTLFVTQFANSFLVGFGVFTATLVSSAVFAPLIEEFSKAFPLFYRHGETERSIFTLALFVGLGFGIVEMLTYVLLLGANPIVRLHGLFFHPASTAITAYGIATKRPLPFYLVAVILHFSNNFLALTNPFSIQFSTIIVAITVFTAWRLHGKTQEKFIN